MVKPEDVKPGAAVLDVGVSRDEDGKIVGDVHPGVAEVAAWISPNPGGVGPMTRAQLLSERRRGGRAVSGRRRGLTEKGAAPMGAERPASHSASRCRRAPADRPEPCGLSPFTRDTARPEGGGRAADVRALAPARQWPLLVVLGGVVLGLVGTAAGGFRAGAVLIGTSLLAGALVRWLLPSVGMLAVRSRVHRRGHVRDCWAWPSCCSR